MTNPNRTYLWQVASSSLVHKQGSWYAAADRTLGDGWGLFAPLRDKGEQGWEVAAPAETLFQLTRLVVDDLRELQFPQEAQQPTHYLCLARYDYPEDRPGSNFPAVLDPQQRLLRQEQPLLAPPDKVSAQDLEAAVHALWRQDRGKLALQMVRAPAGGEQETPPASTADARAFQAPRDVLSFVFASCQYPAGMMDRDQATRSCRLLAERFATRLPTRVLLLGDQVYADATYGLMDPTRLDDRYRLPYEQLNAHDGPLAQLPQDFRQVLRMTPDDHEITDNWEPWGPRARGERYRRGLAAYWRYQRGEGAAQDRDVWIMEPGPQDPREGWHLFMADTRTRRHYRNERTIATASLLGEPQTTQLEGWLQAAPRQDLKIVTSAALLLPRARMFKEEPLRLDSWQGYPASFHRLLAFLCDQQIPNVVFLSGDAHLGCSAKVRVSNGATGRSIAFESHHAPALYAPYPFANETMWNLLLEDCFFFQQEDGTGVATTYQCEVAASVLGESVNGFGLLEARRDGAGWKLATTFGTAAALGPDQEIRTPCSAAM